MQTLSCSTGHPPAQLSPPFPADPSTGCIGPGIIPALSLSHGKHSGQSKEDSPSEEKEHTFQSQKTYEAHEGQGLAPRGTHEAKSTGHSLGAQAANGSALAVPHCQEVSTSCPKSTHSPQDVPRPRGKLYHISWHAKWRHHPTRGIYNSLCTWAEFRNPGISRKTSGWHCTENK